MFQTGQKIGPYILERELGEGSYGVVWLAEERTGLIQRQVALKLPKDADPDIDAIRREAETWLRAGKHPNVVQVLHADIYDGQVAIATEYVAGGSLHSWLQRQEGRVSTVEYAVEMTCGILSGLQHLHSLPSKPLVHRDLKPGNVLLKDGAPLLTDFGLAEFSARPHSPRRAEHPPICRRKHLAIVSLRKRTSGRQELRSTGC